MKLSKLLLIPLFLFAFTIAGCDNDSNSNAQEPGLAPADCPCFTLDDVLDISMKTTGFSCDFSAWQLTLIGNSEGPDNSLSGACSSAGIECTCFGPGSGSMIMDVSLDEASMCMNTLINGLI